MFLVLFFQLLQGRGQGLQFNSNDSLLAKRTSYQVFKNDPPTFSGHLYINFDLSLWDNEHLGYIINITDSKNNSYSLSSIYTGAPFLNFNIDSKSNKIKIPLTLAQLKKRNWMPVKIDLDLKANTVRLFINGVWYHADGFDFGGTITPKIYFGKNEHYSDVPKMAVRNLTIGDGSKTYSFPLNEWSGKNVLSSDGDEMGTVDNPVWLINESYFWAYRLTKAFKEVAGVNFDQTAQKLLMFKSDSLIVYDVQRNNLTEQAFQNKCPLPLHLGKSIINTKENKLYAYETLKAPKQFQPAHSIAALDLNTLKWDITGDGTIAEQRHHHNIFYDNTEDKLYLFGGYGSFSYYKDFFEYNKTTDTWDKIVFTGDKIMPRFFSGFSKADENNDVYIFGGYGNQSGNQVVGGQHFYDLYRVNLTNHTIKKLWEIKPPAVDFVAANNLIISKDKQYFYAICYAHDKPKTSLSLYKFSIKDGSYEVVSGNIPAKGERIESDINLFYNTKQEIFYCAIQEFTTPDYSTVRVYSLASPPVREQDYLASIQPNLSSGWTIRIHYLSWWLLFFIVFASAAYFYFRKKRKSKETPEEIDHDIAISTVHKKEDEKRPNALYLLGDFTVYDKASRDITHLFSPKIKQLFILVLLNSENDGGVTSKKISATLWPEKDIAKSKNIKGVTINHLRNILVDINGIELAFVNDTYRFTMTDELWCDYFVVENALKELRNGSPMANGVLNYIDLIARGSLLREIAEPWLDAIKQNYEEALTAEMSPAVKNIYEAGDYRKTLEIARVILNIDPFNDIAIKYKLKALRRIKGVEHAHKIYNDFAAEYEKSLGEAYPVPFDKICPAK
ncbi:MAG TPA: kelch repeat-containing protein [Mucilaginibacter sp.]